MVLPLLEERVGVRSSFPTDLRFMLDAGPHPGPLPSDGRGDGCRPSSVGGELHGLRSRRFWGDGKWFSLSWRRGLG